MDVLLLVSRSLSTTDMARELRIAEGTVRSHVSLLEGKLSARGRAELLMRALDEGILEPVEAA